MSDRTRCIGGVALRTTGALRLKYGHEWNKRRVLVSDFTRRIDSAVFCLTGEGGAVFRTTGEGGAVFRTTGEGGAVFRTTGELRLKVGDKRKLVSDRTRCIDGAVCLITGALRLKVGSECSGHSRLWWYFVVVGALRLKGGRCSRFPSMWFETNACW